MIPWLNRNDPFPPIECALSNPNGLLAAGADLSAARLLEAYRHGIFPWFDASEPVLWWSPNPRMVLFPGEFRVSRSLRKTLAKRDYEVRVDTAFRPVMRACAEPRQGQDGTWITPQMIRAYSALHEQGYAHSIETWVDDELAGGLYGVALGRVFFGESMFAHRTDASKIALAHLVARLRAQGFGLIDCQMETAHLASLGARPLSREIFIPMLRELVNYPASAAKWAAHPISAASAPVTASK
ncbi:MAG: leucyl/phenylalanyl-tRNA--protein transferase [Burkholderiales bacterium]|nr:leucyl/phenylalanyl-tRNA--protein transferase [Burkholderiales bacterium]MDQ3195427.1 leucyl/phenylalanyl-tRNA--protein transferase [Pseudomonadota bacterium]